MGEFNASSHLYAGFVGGLASSIALQPFDLLKTRVQQSHDASLRSVLRSMSSLKELWRGTVPSAVRMSAGASMYLTLLGTLRSKMAQYNAPVAGYSSDLPKLSMQMNLALGAIARSAVGFLTMPATIVKVRYESSLYNYTSLRQAITSIYAEKGTKGFFTGYGVTISRDAPYAGLYVLFYEKWKDVLNAMYPSTADYRGPMVSAILNTSSAVAAATLATSVTAPFDTIKTKVQLNPDKYRSLWFATRIIMTESGLWSFFDGLSLRLSRKALSAGISWCVYEELVRRIDRYGTLM